MASRKSAGRVGWGGIALAGVALVLIGCGRNGDDGSMANPVGVSGVPGAGGAVSSGGGGAVAVQAITVVAERSRQPVQASVVVRGDSVEITAPGFLPRRQPAALSEAVLWEDDSALPYDVTQNLVYKGGRLNRPEVRNLTVWVDPALDAQPRFADAVNGALSTIQRQTPYSVVRTEGTAFIEIRSGRVPGFLAYVTTTGATIQHARIEVGSPDAYWGPHLQRAITHEIGHVFGLSDCDLSAGMMCSPEPLLDFSAHEQEVLRKMVERSPGNLAPDMDPFGAGSSSKTTRQVCSLPQAD